MIRARFPAVAAAADDIRTNMGQLQSEIQDLNSYLQNELLFWEGAANSEYWVSQTKWNTAAGNIADLLNNFATRLDNANEHLATTERNIRDQMTLA